MNQENNQDCRVCGTHLNDAQDIGGSIVFDCPRCGRWQTIPAPPNFYGPATLREVLGSSLHRRSRASHVIRRQQRDDGGQVGVPIAELTSWGLDDPLPSPTAQIDSLVLWLGRHQQSAPEQVAIDRPLTEAWLGCAIVPDDEGAALNWLVSQPLCEHFIQSPPQFDIAQSPELRLTVDGWTRYGELLSSVVRGKTVLMAMKFGDEELDAVVETCFRPAVAQAGFQLMSFADTQPAGLIDDQLRVALRTSRFVVADITHRNLGAYWEAGFAEGLGRPVIYTCRKAEWDRGEAHFDTNHLRTIVWEAGSLEEAGAKLTAMIRATLPEEAQMVPSA